MKYFAHRLSGNEINKEAKEALTSIGCHVWRNPQRTVKHRKFVGEHGASDVIGFHIKTGCFVACEGKADGDKLSEDQHKFLNLVDSSGGLAYVAFQENGGTFQVMLYWQYLAHEIRIKKK